MGVALLNIWHPRATLFLNYFLKCFKALGYPELLSVVGACRGVCEGARATSLGHSLTLHREL